MLECRSIFGLVPISPGESDLSVFYVSVPRLGSLSLFTCLYSEHREPGICFGCINKTGILGPPIPGPITI